MPMHNALLQLATFPPNGSVVRFQLRPLALPGPAGSTGSAALVNLTGYVLTAGVEPAPPAAPSTPPSPAAQPTWIPFLAVTGDNASVLAHLAAALAIAAGYRVLEDDRHPADWPSLADLAMRPLDAPGTPGALFASLDDFLLHFHGALEGQQAAAAQAGAVIPPDQLGAVPAGLRVGPDVEGRFAMACGGRRTLRGYRLEDPCLSGGPCTLTASGRCRAPVVVAGEREGAAVAPAAVEGAGEADGAGGMEGAGGGVTVAGVGGADGAGGADAAIASARETERASVPRRAKKARDGRKATKAAQAAQAAKDTKAGPEAVN